MPRALLVLLTALAALGLHLAFGWAWVLAAAIAGGYLGGVAVGALGVGIEWGGLLLWNHLAYPGPVGRMTETAGLLFGGLPGWAVPLLSLAVGLVLGFLGGVAGAQLHRLREESRSRANPAPAR